MTLLRSSHLPFAREKFIALVGIAVILLSAVFFAFDSTHSTAAAALGSPTPGIATLRNGTAYGTGSGYERYAWYGLIAPAGLPAEIVAKLNAAIRKAGDTAEIKEIFSRQGLDSQTTTPEQFAAFIKNDLVQNSKLVSAAGIKAE